MRKSGKEDEKALQKDKRIMLTITAVLLIMLTGCAFPLSVGKLPEPAGAVDSFFNAYKSGSGDAMAEYVYNYSEISTDGLDDTEYHRQLSALLRDNLSVEQGAATVSGKTAYVPLTVTYLDMTAFSEAMKQETSAAAMEYTKQQIFFEDEESVMKLLCEVITRLEPSVGDYLSSEDIMLELRYDHGWRVVIDDSLCGVLTGGLS